MFTITRVAWMNGGRVSVVEVYDEVMDKQKYYIRGHETNTTQEWDTTDAARYGSKIDEKIAQDILKEYGQPIKIEYNP